MDAFPRIDIISNRYAEEQRSEIEVAFPLNLVPVLGVGTKEWLGYITINIARLGILFWLYI